MQQIRFLRGKQEDLDKLIEKANAFPIGEEESDSENELKNETENEIKK